MLIRLDLELSRIRITARTLGGFFVLVMFLAGLAVFSWIHLIEIDDSIRAAAHVADADAAVGQINVQLDRLNSSARRFLHSRAMADVTAARVAAKETGDALDLAIARFGKIGVLAERGQDIKELLKRHTEALEVTATATERQSASIDGFLSASAPLTNIMPLLAQAALDSGDLKRVRTNTQLANLFHASKEATARYAMTLQPNDAESAQQEQERFGSALAAQRRQSGNEKIDRLFAVINAKAPTYRASIDEIFKAIALKAEAERELSRTTGRLDEVFSSLKQDFAHLRLQAVDSQAAMISAIKTWSVVIACSAIMIAIMMAWLIGGSIARPILRMTEAMQQLAAGNLRITVPALNHRDEVGHMAKALEVFRENALHLRKNQSLLDAVIHSAPIMINVKDMDGHIVLMNEYQAKLHNLSPMDAVGQSFHALVGQACGDESLRLDRQVVETASPLLDFEQPYRDSAGNEMRLVSSKVPLMGEGGAVTHVVTVAVDVTRRMLAEEALKATKEEAEAARDQVSNLLKNLAIAHTELEQKNRDLEKLSITDRLTGLYNRRKLDEEIAEEYARAKRSHLPLSVIMMDIDRFKSVNDNLGHQAGDRVLSEFANILRRTIREVDLVGRWGGEEFMIQCPGTDLGGAVSLAEKLRETIATHVFEDGGRMTGSFGVTDLRPNETLDEMIKRADDALYRAKKSGRNRVESG